MGFLFGSGNHSFFENVKEVPTNGDLGRDRVREKGGEIWELGKLLKSGEATRQPVM